MPYGYLHLILIYFLWVPPILLFSIILLKYSPLSKDAYQGFMLQEPDSVLSWVLNEYFTYLYSINYQLDFNNSAMSKVFFDTCDWLVSEAEKRVNN